ncbi:E3 ubiquitin-protein ligase RNF115 [Lucilia cuprina]|nr:E3 ubiquitin-protein ligase RNF115 [Lucilia cuprina]
MSVTTVSAISPKRLRTEGAPLTIGTHSSTFHCDEVLACFMLKQLPEYENAKILRSRNDDELHEHCDIIVDETMSSLRPELGDQYNIRLSSAGLVFCFYGERVIDEILKKHANVSLSPANLKLTFNQLYANFISELDAIDNGVPICPDGGFVEELPPAAAASNSVGGSSSTSNAGFMGGGNDEQQLETLRGQIANLLASRNGPNLEININPSSMRNQPRGIVSLGPLPTGGGRVRPQSLDRLDDVLLNFLQSISVGSGAVAGEINPFDNSQLLFMGNLGDYAWGREGLDTIVTQLLNQMETSGPPPLAKDKIDDIPKVNISAEEVERKLQCSVCWEDFKINEKVRKLPCSHLYHEDCIVPWLNLHGTCPICRKSLNGEEDDENDVHMDIVDEHQRPATASVCPIHQQQQQQQQSQQNQNNTTNTVGEAIDEDNDESNELLQELQENNQDSEFTRLTEMVRQHYLNYLEKQLQENLLNSNSNNNKRNALRRQDYDDEELCKKSIRKTAELLEDKAVKACMIAKFYQRAMVKITPKVSKRQQQQHHRNYRRHNRQRSEQHAKPKQEEVFFSPTSSIVTAPTSPISPAVQKTPLETCLIEAETASHEVENENSNDSVAVELARLFSEEKTELDEIFGIDPNEEPDDPQICKILKEIEDAKINQTTKSHKVSVINTKENPESTEQQDNNCLLEPKEITPQNCQDLFKSIDLSKSIWPCELFMQRRKLSESLARLIEEDLRWHDVMKWKFAQLFGEDSDDEFTPCSPSIELDEVLIGSCIRRISPWVVHHLMKPMRDGLIGNRFLFKKLAKSLARSIIMENQYPDESIIKDCVETFFCLHQAVMSLEDLNLATSY